MAPISKDTRVPREDGLYVEKLPSGSVDVFYVPPAEKLFESQLDPKHQVKLLHINCRDKSLTVFPTTNYGGPDNFLQPRYAQIERIRIADPVLVHHVLEESVPETSDEILWVLKKLPDVFLKNYRKGLGLKEKYRFVVDAVEELSNCTEIVISKSRTCIDLDKRIFFIATADFKQALERLCFLAAIGRRNVRIVSEATAYNILAERTGHQKRPENVDGDLLLELPVTDTQQEAALSVLTKNTKAIAEKKPDELAKLKSNIEYVELDGLINRYDKMINNKRLKEDHWQKFFAENRFILNLAFGYPITIVKDQASVGGHRLDGSGGKIVDFLVKNKVTNNAAIVEIKTPGTPLLNKKPYRSEVYQPSGDLSGSISQVLDQKHYFQREFAQKMQNSKISDLELYSVHCCLIIGTTPTEADQVQSFEYCRGNSKDVGIVTFDELLTKLKQFQNLLAPKDTEPVA